MSATIMGTDLSARRRTNLRRRFLLVSTALLATLLAILGVGFAADAGTTTVSVTSADGVLVYPIGSASTAPAAAITLPKTSSTPAASGTAPWATSVTPAWAVAAGTAGTVTTPGDLVYIDATVATSTKVMISVYVTNLDKMAVNYSSWAFGIGIYQSSTGASGSWTKVTDSYVTSDRGAYTFTIDVSSLGKHLAVAMNDGTFYTVQVDQSNGSLTPSFFIRATEL